MTEEEFIRKYATCEMTPETTVPQREKEALDFIRQVRVKTLEDIATSLIDWDVMYGHEKATPEDKVSHEIASWIMKKAEELNIGTDT